MESKKGVFDTTADENTVTFTPAHKKDFEFAKGEIDRRIAHAKKGSVGQAAGLLELEKLASLKEKGILSLEEFAAKKQQILEGSDTLDAMQVRAYRKPEGAFNVYALEWKRFRQKHDSRGDNNPTDGNLDRAGRTDYLSQRRERLLRAARQNPGGNINTSLKLAYCLSTTNYLTQFMD